MVHIKPLRAYYYDLRALDRSPERLVAPPYDVISEELRNTLASEQYNIVNIMLGDKGDSYANAAEIFQEWIASGKLVQDERECYYAYEQTFRIDGRPFQRTGIVALVRLEPLGGNIVPHEKTHPGARQDRMELLSAVNANIEQIFLVYDDKEEVLRPIIDRIKQPENELLSFADFDDVIHRVFRIQRPEDIARVTEVLGGMRVLIADGHHRYETALAYSEKKDREQGNGAHDYVLATLVNSHDPGLVMLTTHRIVHSVDVGKIDDLESRLADRFEIEQVSDKIALLDRLEGSEGCGLIGLWLVKAERGLLITLKPGLCSSDPLEKLDVSILHRYVIEESLGITPEMQDHMEKIDFVKGTEQEFLEVSMSDAQLICVLKPPAIPDVFSAADTGRKMPHKATYFYPKLWSGLLIYVF